jgi:hypothetical protein
MMRKVLEKNEKVLINPLHHLLKGAVASMFATQPTPLYTAANPNNAL